MFEAAILLTFVVLIGAAAQWINHTAPFSPSATPSGSMPKLLGPMNPAEAERCKVPEFAKAMGHEEKWKQHNNCQ